MAPQPLPQQVTLQQPRLRRPLERRARPPPIPQQLLLSQQPVPQQLTPQPPRLRRPPQRRP
ncbi:MAG: hypothetical protein ACK5Q5_09635 [Planctomycetaceae bacterium]